MPIKISPYRPLPFTLDGSEPPCRLGEDAPDVWVFWRENWSEYSRLTLNMSKAFKDVGLPTMDPFSEGAGERTWQIPSRDTRVRVGLGGVRDYGAEWVARAVAAALAGFPVPEPPEPKPPADDPVPGFIGGVGDGPADVGSLAPLAGLGMLGGQEDPSPAPSAKGGVGDGASGYLLGRSPSGGTGTVLSVDPPIVGRPPSPLEDLLTRDALRDYLPSESPGTKEWDSLNDPALRMGGPIQLWDSAPFYPHGRG